jgi:hypothetical protein
MCQVQKSDVAAVTNSQTERPFRSDRMTIEECAHELIDGIVQDAMDKEFKEAIEPFDGRVTPQMAKTIATVFEAGVRVGASQALTRIVKGAK